MLAYIYPALPGAAFSKPGRSVLLWVKASNERWARLTCSDVAHSPTQMPTAMAKRRGSVQLLHRAERAAAGLQLCSRALPDRHPSSATEVLPASSARFSPAKLVGRGLTLASAMASACADDWTRACWYIASIGFEAVGDAAVRRGCKAALMCSPDRAMLFLTT